MNLKKKIACKVPFGTLTIGEECVSEMTRILNEGRLTCGELVEKFEKQFAKTMGRKFAVAVSSGTDANTLALASLHYAGSAVRGKSQVIIPALTFVATANSVVNAGLVPRFVDVKKNTLNLDDEIVERYINRYTVAIMPVHLMGKPANMQAICTLAKRKGLFVIEDAAEAHGAEYRSKMVGSFSHMTCYSLYAAHIVSSVEGGMITTDDENLAEILRSLRNHGLQHYGSNWEFRRIGFNAKMNEMEAVIGLSNIKRFKDILNKRRRNLFYLSESFAEFDKYFHYTKEESYERIGPHAFAIILKERLPFTKEQLVDWYNSNGIDNRNLFYCIPTQCPAYSDSFKTVSQFPNAEYCSKFGTHIGVHQDLTHQQLNYVVDKTREFLQKHT